MTAPGSWTVVIPVKDLAAAKSRLAAAAVTAGELPFAFFLDTLAAVRLAAAVGEVVIATADERIASAANERDCLVVSDVAHPGINAAAAWSAGQRHGTGGTAVVVSDLPALTPEALDSVLASAAGHATSFLADADGTGTTMWFATAGTSVDPRFGVDSRAAHRGAGAADLVDLHPDRVAEWATARRDVDTEDALRLAVEQGVGDATGRVLDDLGRGEQIVTVVSRDAEAVAVVDEDGHARVLPWAVVAGAGVRDVHPGQRLALRHGSTQTSTSVRLP